MVVTRESTLTLDFHFDQEILPEVNHQASVLPVQGRFDHRNPEPNQIPQMPPFFNYVTSEPACRIAFTDSKWQSLCKAISFITFTRLDIIDKVYSHVVKDVIQILPHFPYRSKLIIQRRSPFFAKKTHFFRFFDFLDVARYAQRVL